MKKMSTETPAHYRKRLKKECWRVFSLYIRKRDGYVCYTCGAKLNKKTSEAGHFIHGKLDFDPMNVHCQDSYCNKYLHGNLGIYAEKLIKEYGLERVEEMRVRANQIWKPDTQELENLLSHWETMLKEQDENTSN